MSCLPESALSYCESQVIVISIIPLKTERSELLLSASMCSWLRIAPAVLSEYLFLSLQALIFSRAVSPVPRAAV